MSSSLSNRHVKLHPLALVNISDHYTRSQSTSDQVIFGGLFGVQEGACSIIYDSFELIVDVLAVNEILFDANFLTDKLTQYRAVYPHFDFVGWYTITDGITPQHLSLHQNFAKTKENPVLLTLPTNIIADASELPIKVFESSESEPNLVFIDVPFELETSESERLCLDNATQQGGSGAATISYISNLQSSVDMLNERIKVICTYLKAIQAGQVPINHRILREISIVCNELPRLASDDSHTKLTCTVDDDSTLLTSLASLMKGLECMGETSKKSSLIRARESTTGSKNPQ